MAADESPGAGNQNQFIFFGCSHVAFTIFLKYCYGATFFASASGVGPTTTKSGTCGSMRTVYLKIVIRQAPVGAIEGDIGRSGPQAPDDGLQVGLGQVRNALALQPVE